MLNKILLCGLVVLVSCGAAKIKLSSHGEKVEVLKRQPGKECSVLAKVIGENDDGSVDLAQNHARNLVGNKGANAIYFDEEVSNGNSYRIHSTGYACKN
jgi:hypothetical protein